MYLMTGFLAHTSVPHLSGPSWAIIFSSLISLIFPSSGNHHLRSSQHLCGHSFVSSNVICGEKEERQRRQGHESAVCVMPRDYTWPRIMAPM